MQDAIILEEGGTCHVMWMQARFAEAQDWRDANVVPGEQRTPGVARARFEQRHQAPAHVGPERALPLLVEQGRVETGLRDASATWTTGPE